MWRRIAANQSAMFARRNCELQCKGALFHKPYIPPSKSLLVPLNTQGFLYNFADWVVYVLHCQCRLFFSHPDVRAEVSKDGSFLSEDVDLMRLLYLFVREVDARHNLVPVPPSGVRRSLIRFVMHTYFLLGAASGSGLP